MSKTITVNAIIYNGKYDDLNESYFEALTDLPFKKWLKEHNKTRVKNDCEPDGEDEFDVHTRTFNT